MHTKKKTKKTKINAKFYFTQSILRTASIIVPMLFLLISIDLVPAAGNIWIRIFWVVIVISITILITLGLIAIENFTNNKHD